MDSIDEIPPVVYASGIPETYIPLRGLQRKGYDVRGRNDHVPRKRISGQSTDGQNGDGELKGDELDWITFPITTNGSYQVKATDQAGLVSYRVLEIQYLDDIAPSIQFDRSIVNVFQGTTAEELREQLLDATTFRLWDNIDSNPQISLKNMLTENR